ncbi:agmatinase [Acidobacteriota bacterium]
MDIALLPVQYEETTSAMRGCVRGPEAILASMHELDKGGDALADKISKHCHIEIDNSFDRPFTSFDEMNEQLYRRINVHLAAGRLPVTLGGEHTVTFSAFRAVLEHAGTLHMVQCDAHSDLRSAYEGTPWSHASAMRRVVELGAGRLVACGIRSQCIEDAACTKAPGVTIIPAKEVNDAGIQDYRILSGLSGPVYLTIDMDFFDPSEAPGVGTPEPGGVTYIRGLSLIRQIVSTLKVVSFDIVELMPLPGRPHTEALAARLFYEILDAFLSCPA